LVKRRKRDAYGNWVWEETDDTQPPEGKIAGDEVSSLSRKNVKREKDEELKLEWRDFIALSIASLETILLPVVIFILVLLGIVLGLSLFH
jgi:hypothetical protein